ncbi:MAG: DUF4870 domain-containing protein [Phycisphaerales bacterium]
MNPREVYSEVVNGKGRVVDPQAAEWERTYSMFMHLTLLAATFFLPVIPALVMWLIKKDQSPYVDDHGREAINFQLSLTLYTILLVPLMAIITCGVGLVLYIPIYVMAIVGMIVAAKAANSGEYYRYPATIRFLH